MKTKFILHGGMLKYDNEHNISFFKEFTKDLEDGDQVLFVGFARRDIENRMQVFKRDKSLILAGTDKDVEVVNAEYETLMDQIKDAKAVFVTGGETLDLMKDLREYPGFRDAISGKVYAGSSAGALVTSTYMHTCSHDKIVEGLGWLPIRLIVHYGNPEYNATEETKTELEAYPNDLELITIPETEWIVREVED